MQEARYSVLYSYSLLVPYLGEDNRRVLASGPGE